MKRKKNILCPLRSTRLESAKGLLLCYAVCVILFLGFKLCAGLWVFLRVPKWTIRTAESDLK